MRESDLPHFSQLNGLGLKAPALILKNTQPPFKTGVVTTRKT